MSEVVIPEVCSHLQHLITKLLTIPLHFDGFSKKKYYHHTVCNYCFLYKGTKQVDTNYSVPIRVKLLSLLQKLFSPTLTSVFTEVSGTFLFDAVRLCFTQLLSPLWSDRVCPFSETPVSLLTHHIYFL
jgi:ribosomal protein L32